MKKIVLAFAILILSVSCSDKEVEPTTYQIFNNSNLIVTDIEDLDGSMYEVIVYHYSGTKIIHQDTIVKISTMGGKTSLLDVPANTELFKVSFMFLPAKSPYYNAPWNIRFYMIAYKMIVAGENNILGVNGGSFISDTIVKSDKYFPHVPMASIK